MLGVVLCVFVCVCFLCVWRKRDLVFMHTDDYYWAEWVGQVFFFPPPLFIYSFPFHAIGGGV